MHQHLAVHAQTALFRDVLLSCLQRFATNLLGVGVVGLVVHITITTNPAGRVVLVNQAIVVIINACSKQC